MNLGFYDQMLVLDSGVYEIRDEDLLDFFDYAQVPIDVEPIDLEHVREWNYGTYSRRVGEPSAGRQHGQARKTHHGGERS